MVKQHRLIDWRSLAIAISLGIFSVAQTPARAIPVSGQSSFDLSQVGIGSRINRPTPLNLRPRTHIPLPTVNGRSNSYYRYPEYRDRHYDGYEYGHDHYHTHRRQNRHRKGTVIIINPDSYSGYSNYDPLIRIIRK